MSIDQYLLSLSELIICDSELDIQIVTPFDLPRLSQKSESRGVVREKDPAGNVRCTYLVSDGRRHGECRIFAEDSTVRSEMFYLHGKLHGPSIMYGDQGQVLAKTWYYDGKRMGKAYFYSTSGALVSLQRFKDGQWEGIQEYFYENGAAKSLIPFNQGKFHGEVRLFWESGTLKRSVHYVGGLRSGKDQLWNEQGLLIDEGEYSAGKPTALHRRHFSNGQLKEEFYYHTPLRFDRKEWNASGKLIFEGIFAPDLTYTEKVYLEPHGAKVRKGVWNGNHIRWE